MSFSRRLLLCLLAFCLLALSTRAKLEQYRVDLGSTPLITKATKLTEPRVAGPLLAVRADTSWLPLVVALALLPAAADVALVVSGGHTAYFIFRPPPAF